MKWIRSVCALLACAILAAACALPWRSDGGADGGANAGAAARSADGAAPGTTRDPEAEAADAARAATETAVALDRLERMADWIAAQRSFRFRADVSYDAVQATGERIEFGGAREVIVERPDRLRIDVVDRDGDREILAYDGREIWIASPTLRAFARAPHAGPVEGLIDRLADLDAPLPLADLIDPGVADRLRPQVESASRVGLVRLDGRVCEQIAYRTADVDFQLFVEPGDAPIPRRIVVDYREAPGRPQFRASLRDWELSPRTRPPEFFRISPPIGAQRLELAELVELMRANDETAGPDASAP